MLLEKAIDRFGALLRTRLEQGVFTTEDSVRYTFFAALLETGDIQPESVILEFPHPDIKGAKIDTWLPSLDGKTHAIEFKYDRQIPSGKNLPRPQKAGAVFNDLSRLARIAGRTRMRCLFIYLTDREMAGYLSNPDNGLADFFSLRPGQALKIDGPYILGKSSTFQKAVGGSFQTELVSFYAAGLPKQHQLRIYEVHSRV